MTGAAGEPGHLPQSALCPRGALQGPSPEVPGYNQLHALPLSLKPRAPQKGRKHCIQELWRPTAKSGRSRQSLRLYMGSDGVSGGRASDTGLLPIAHHPQRSCWPPAPPWGPISRALTSYQDHESGLREQRRANQATGSFLCIPPFHRAGGRASTDNGFK